MPDSVSLTMEDGEKVFCYKWLPKINTPPKAAIQIAHGMAEHAKRYDPFARFLVDSGFCVYANDHRGHGNTAGFSGKIGHFADENGWNLAVKDMHAITCFIKEQYPGLPIFLFGHSMGSFLSRHYIALYGNEVKGVILSGTGGDPGLLGCIGRFIAFLECRIKGIRSHSLLLTKLSFGKFNNSFKPNRTDFDWLSRDDMEVDKYIGDPFCGEVFTAGFFHDLFTGMKFINQSDNIKKIPKNLPVYLFSGDKDPVGNNKKGVEQVYNSYKKAGFSDVKLKFYKGGRHEMLNEINRKEVYGDIVGWLNEHV
jgi:alpha-beta hydrolase superfamily lysophospholipase